jgi:hypothetical protein
VTPPRLDVTLQITPFFWKFWLTWCRKITITGRGGLTLAEKWLAKLDWRFDVVDGRFRDPEGPGADDGEPASALVFAVAPSKVLVFGKGEPFSQARYRFA